MAKLLTIPAGRTAKWVILAVALVVLFASFGANLPGKFTDAENNESTSFLPGDAESTKALTITEELQGGEQAPIVIIYRRQGGLSPEDTQRIADDRAELNQAIAENRDDVYRAVSEFGEPQPSESGDAALLVGNITGDGDGETILDPIDDIRERVSDPGGGLEVKVTGPAGFAADAIKVFENINGTLLGAALLLVVVLLILIYRSPIFLWIPLFAVVFAEVTTRSIGYALTEIGVTVNGQSSAILSILVLGAGTDYALLLVSRYREELRKHEDKHEAMALALRTAGPAIVASGATVICALLCLSVAEVEGTAGLGPIGALGIAVAVATMLTVLPALLVICGRRAFWRPPVFGWTNGIPHYGDEGADETHGAWRRIGERVARNPRRIWIGTASVLAVGALGLLTIDTGLTQADAYREEVESLQGQELLAQSFPAGASAATEIIVADPADVEAVTEAVQGVDGVAVVRPTELSNDRGTLVNAILEPEPYSTEAFNLVPDLRAAAKEAGGPGTLVGGPSAIEYDVRQSAARDTKLIIPIALVVVLGILILLLRSLVAPLLLIGTVILSFAAALGISLVVFDVVFGFAGVDPSFPLFAFIFLVALGIDYNIFLMARVREETARHGTRQGMIRGLAVTGGVITSAGIVLAGTFSVLALLPLVFLTEIGFVIAFGVLLDTFIVRSILVPALVLDIGPKIWWPSRLQHEDGGAAAPPAEGPGVGATNGRPSAAERVG
ncbi:MAG TPA: MMPL family transporter [Solirubrobacteraceae bacterium]|jgi:RND superfamily putative drug exporter|nr:MMPL family transporter [Solirubrobacteraceae bacterium]